MPHETALVPSLEWRSWAGRRPFPLYNPLRFLSNLINRCDPRWKEVPTVLCIDRPRPVSKEPFGNLRARENTATKPIEECYSPRAANKRRPPGLFGSGRRRVRFKYRLRNAGQSVRPRTGRSTPLQPRKAARFSFKLYHYPEVEKLDVCRERENTCRQVWPDVSAERPRGRALARRTG
jgi:hypothetical protein